MVPSCPELRTHAFARYGSFLAPSSSVIDQFGSDICNGGGRCPRNQGNEAPCRGRKALQVKLVVEEQRGNVGAAKQIAEVAIDGLQLKHFRVERVVGGLQLFIQRL